MGSVCFSCMLDLPEVMRCVLLCMLEAMEGEVCLLEVLEVPEVMRLLGRVLNPLNLENVPS